jgi:mycothiol synthase
MALRMRSYQTEEDYFLIRNFLREVFLINNRLECSWHVSRLDYWRWHLILNCHYCDPIEKVTTIWENEDGGIAGVLHPLGEGEIRLHVHPEYRSQAMEDAILTHAEEHLSYRTQPGKNTVYLPVFSGDVARQETLIRRGYIKTGGISHHWYRDLDTYVPDILVAAGYSIRSMGTIDEHPPRSWASWKAFHNDEPDKNYDGDWSWYQNIQSAPLYRRDLDIIAVTSQGKIVAFCTIYYDDHTQSAVCVLVGTAVEHQRRGLGKAVMLEGMRRLKKMGCRRVFATAYDPPANGLYGSVMQTNEVAETWIKEWSKEGISMHVSDF